MTTPRITSITPAPSPDPGAAVQFRPIRPEIAAAIEESHSPNTRATYRSVSRRFQTWAAAKGYLREQPRPEIVAEYLCDEAAAGASVGSLRVRRAAIRFHFVEQGQPDPTDNEGVRRTLKGLARRAASNGSGGAKQAAALTDQAAAAIWATACQPRTGPTGRTESAAQAERRGNVDIALVFLMRDALLRRSEAAALTWADVELDSSDGAGRITIRRSKTDQEGAGAVQFVAPRTVRALRRIRPDAPGPGERVFAMTGETISNRIRAAALAAGLEGEFSGHSPRVGMARDLAAVGTELPALMQAGRWKSERMPALYTRNETAGRGAVARYYGQG